MGANDQSIARSLRRGDLVRVRHGAYVAAPIWNALDDVGRHGLRARAVVQQAKTKVVLSHVSGLPEYGAPMWGLDLTDVHITRRDGKAGRHEAGVQQHCGSVAPGEIVVLNGVPVMNPTRLALEVTTAAGVEASLAVMNHMLHEGLTSPDQLAAAAGVMGQWPNSLQTDLVLRLSDGRLESVGESRTLYLCFRQSLPMPVPQYEIRDAAGRLLWRVDFAWPDLGVFLEFDGKVKYEALLKEGQRASDVVIAEKRREDDIRRLTGWRCVRLVWADLEQPERTAATIREALCSADRAA